MEDPLLVNETIGAPEPVNENYFWDYWILPVDSVPPGRLTVMRWITLTWLVVMTTMGVPGNILVIVSLMFMKHLRQLAHLFVANLALFDLGVMFMNSIALIGVIYGDRVMLENPILCEVSGIICMLACFGSLWTMMFVAINRFIFICKNELYSRLFGVKGTVLSLVMIWVCVCLLDLANYPGVGYGGHTFNPPLLHCSFTLDNSWWYNTIIYTGVALALPLAVISYCYWQIYKVAKNSAARSEKRRREQRQLLVSLLTIFAAFVITWTPMGVVLFLAGITSDYTEFIPEEVVIICDLFAHSNSGVNFIIYGFTHRGLRRAYRMWYQMATPCLNSKPDSSSGTISTNEKNGHK